MQAERTWSRPREHPREPTGKPWRLPVTETWEQYGGGHRKGSTERRPSVRVEITGDPI